MLDDAALADMLIKMPFADADLLSQALGVDASTIRRRLQRWHAQGWVRTVTPPCVGKSVSDLSYLTPAGLIARYPGHALDEVIRLARTHQCDPVSLLKHLPHLPQRLTLYDAVLWLRDAAMDALPTYYAWYTRHAAPVPETATHLVQRFTWRENVRVAVKEDGKPHTQWLTFPAHLSISAADRIRSAQDTWWWCIGLWLDDGILPERDMIRRLRLLDLYHRQHSFPETTVRLCVLTFSEVRYAMWRRAADQLRSRLHLRGLLVLARQTHGWPYTSGMSPDTTRLSTGARPEESPKRTQDTQGDDYDPAAASWVDDMTVVGAGGGDLPAVDLLFDLPGRRVDPEMLGPPSASAVVGHLQRRFFSEPERSQGLDDWIQGRVAHPERVADVVRRAAYSLTLSRRAHQLLMLIVSAPLISVEDLCVLCQVRADAMGEMLRELIRTQLIEVVALTSPVGIPGYDGHAQRCVRAVRATDAAVQYLDAVYEKLLVWHRRQRRPQIHDTGVARLLVMLETSLKHLRPRAHLWWRVGPSAALRYRRQVGWPLQGEAVTIFPDAHGVVFQPDPSGYHPQPYQRFWVEWDMGSMHQQQLAEKLTKYRDYVQTMLVYSEEGDNREWMRVQQNLLVVAPYERQEARILDIVAPWQQSLARYPFRIYVTTCDRLMTAVLDWTCPLRPELDSSTAFLGLVDGRFDDDDKDDRAENQETTE